MRLLNFTHSDGRALGVQPAAIITIETAQAKTREDFPGSESFIRYLMGGRPATARLRNTPSRVLERLRKIDPRPWLSAQLAEGGDFHIRPEAIDGIDGLEQTSQTTARSVLHFDFGGAVATPYGLVEEAGELLEQLAELERSAPGAPPAANLDEDFAA